MKISGETYTINMKVYIKTHDELLVTPGVIYKSDGFSKGNTLLCPIMDKYMTGTWVEVMEHPHYGATTYRWSSVEPSPRNGAIAEWMVVYKEDLFDELYKRML